MSESVKNNEWYSNKDLFEMMQSFKKELQDVRDTMRGLNHDMQLTRSEIKQYNNLRASLNQCITEVHEVKQEVHDMKSEAKGKKSVGVAVIAWTSFGIGIITLLAKMTGWF